MNFDEYQNKTEETNVYSRQIEELINPIRSVVLNSHYNNLGDMYDALRRLDTIENILVLSYVLLGYAGEIGEILNSFKKVIRGDKSIIEFMDEAEHEIGDSYWYGIGQLPGLLGMDAGEIAQENLNKLQERKDKDTIKGDGDHR